MTADRPDRPPQLVQPGPHPSARETADDRGVDTPPPRALHSIAPERTVLSLSRVVQDLIKALTTTGTYRAIGTAGNDDESISATICAVGTDGVQHHFEVRFSPHC